VKAIKSIVLVLTSCLFFYSCGPVLIGGLIWKSQKNKTEKSKFLQELNRVNTEREKAGLAPLNKCVEVYHFDPGWAAKMPDCQSVIDSLLALQILPDSTKVFKSERRDNDSW